MKLVKITDLRPGDIFLTKTSKLLVYGFRDRSDVVAYRYSDRYYCETLKATAMVYKMENL